METIHDYLSLGQKCHKNVFHFWSKQFQILQMRLGRAIACI